MARLARVVVAGVAHHVTQRGNGRRFILNTGTDRQVYMDLLRQSIDLHQVALMGYCLMSNHVHLVAIPARLDALGMALKDAHGRYAAYWNAVNQTSGHVWQGRYYSCPLDESHTWEALRYTELNPVRAGLVEEAGNWAWSSASTHCATPVGDDCLAMERWASRWDGSTWAAYLAGGEDQNQLSALRRSTHTGRPLGTAEFVRTLEGVTHRSLVPQRRGRPRPTITEETQSSLSFDF